MYKSQSSEGKGLHQLSWVPKAALNYIAHTEEGASIRALARKTGCHASTVSRQVRSFEAKRDDILVDEALRRLAPQCAAQAPSLTEDRLNRHARTSLRALCQKGAVLAVAAGMDKAVVVRETAVGTSRIAVVDRDIAEAMALKSWISCEASGRISRYWISAAGRAVLARMVAEQENLAVNGIPDDAVQEDQDPFDPNTKAASEGRPRVRYGIVDTPLVLLSRRRDRDGNRFLSEALLRAGEQLREDFQMAELDLKGAMEWQKILSQLADCADRDGVPFAASVAHDRVMCALRELGPGLGDVVLRCCCLLEGLETAEKNMGWSARSGKIVLRIALQRLARHYAKQGDAAGLMG